MIFQYQRTGKMVEVLNDLIKIHNDRIAGYKYALNQSTEIESGLYNAFEEIISDTKYYIDQISEKIKELNGNPLKGSTILGKIYQAWVALKVTFPGSTQKAIISACLYNEEIALHAYNAALSSNLNMPAQVRQLIENQEHELRRIHSLVNKYRESRHLVDHRLAYFV